MHIILEACAVIAVSYPTRTPDYWPETFARGRKINRNSQGFERSRSSTRQNFCGTSLKQALTTIKDAWSKTLFKMQSSRLLGRIKRPQNVVSVSKLHLSTLQFG